MNDGKGPASELLKSTTGTPQQPKENIAVSENKQPEQSVKLQERKKVMDFSQQFYCDALNDSNINTIVDGKQINVIVLVGFVGYGKTTFAGSLYYRLLTNLSYHGQRFIDSDTYAGHERRLAIRTLKTPIDADTKRTIKGEDHILALTLQDETDESVSKVVISDRSGEDYDDYTGQADDMEGDALLKVADTVVFFIDTEALMKSSYAIEYNYGLLLDGINQHSILAEGCRVILAFNKHDTVKDDMTQQFQQKSQTVENLFKSKLTGKEITVKNIDSTGASDDFASVDALAKLLLTESASESDSELEELDWVNARLKVLRHE